MTDVLRRKIDRARQPLADGAPGADRCWRLALARAARDGAALDLEVRRLSVTRCSLTEIIDTAPDRVLVALLDGPEGGLGVLMLSPEVTAALIEMQTLTRLARQAPLARKPTRIDAAMVAGVIDRALAGLEDGLAEEADLAWAGGFRYASFLEEVRPLSLLLEEDLYRVLRAEVVLCAPSAAGSAAATGGAGPLDVPEAASAGRTGEVILMLPAEGRGQRPLATAEDVLGAATQFGQALSAQVMQVDCRLEALVGRLRLPLHQIMALQPGDVLPLPLAGVDAIMLETPEGRPVATARLGQHRGMRAVKLDEVAPARSGTVAAFGLRPNPSPGVPAATEPDTLRVAS